MIQPQELQRMLREFGGPLAQATVEQNVLSPFYANIKWVCSLDGDLHYAELAHFDLRSLRDTMDVMTFAARLKANMDAAAAQARAH